MKGRGRKPAQDSVLRRLRGLCARALDDAAPEPERNASALALCRELRKLGFLSDDAAARGIMPRPAPERPVGVSSEHGRVHLRREVIVPQNAGAERRWVDFDPPKPNR